MRIDNDKNYQNLLKELKKNEDTDEESSSETLGQFDLQLLETYNVMRDLLFLMYQESHKNLLEKKSTKPILQEPVKQAA